MKLRKINAVFSLLTTILVLGHAIALPARMLSQGSTDLVLGHATALTTQMLSQGSTYKASSFMPWALTVVFVIHAIICIIFMISSHKGAPKNNGKQYPKMNISTMVQRITGVLMIIFTPLHILGALGVIQTPQVVHAIVPPLFFLLVMAHVAVSTSKAFITLGIGNARFVKCVDVVIKVVCAVTLIADIIGFYLYVY